MSKIAHDVAVTAAGLQKMSDGTFCRHQPLSNSSLVKHVLDGTAILFVGGTQYPLSGVDGSKDPLSEVAQHVYSLAVKRNGLDGVDVRIVNPLTNKDFTFRNLHMRVGRP